MAGDAGGTAYGDVFEPGNGEKGCHETGGKGQRGIQTGYLCSVVGANAMHLIHFSVIMES